MTNERAEEIARRLCEIVEGHLHRESGEVGLRSAVPILAAEIRANHTKILKRALAAVRRAFKEE